MPKFPGSFWGVMVGLVLPSTAGGYTQPLGVIELVATDADAYCDKDMLGWLKLLCSWE